jgi:hypothetical protein
MYKNIFSKIFKIKVFCLYLLYNLKQNKMNIDVNLILPEGKDYQRAKEMDFYKHGMRNWFYGNGAPIQSLAEKQAKLIKDPVKLVRRAKAVAAVWGTRDYHGYASGVPKEENVWNPFENALRAMGFTREQINSISSHRESDEVLRRA